MHKQTVIKTNSNHEVPLKLIINQSIKNLTNVNKKWVATVINKGCKINLRYMHVQSANLLQIITSFLSCDKHFEKKNYLIVLYIIF